MTIVRSLDEIPSFATEAEEADYWGTHGFSDAILDQMGPLPPDVLLPTRTRPISIRLNYDNVGWLAVATMVYSRWNSEFDWDEGNAQHIARKSVEPDEAEEAIRDPHRIAVPVYDSETEERFGFLGATQQGRVLLVIVTKRGNRWRVVTARSAQRSERRRYRRR